MRAPFETKTATQSFANGRGHRHIYADTTLISQSHVKALCNPVERLTHEVRDPRAGYRKTLDVLAHAKKHRPEVLTKTSLMVGLGETEEEILETMDDLRAIGVDILTLGQYLRPTPNHLPVERYVTPEEFNRYRDIGLEKGFMEVPSGPMVRSSYRADRVFDKNNLGLSVPEVPVPDKAMQIPVKAVD